MLLGPLLIMY